MRYHSSSSDFDRCSRALQNRCLKSVAYSKRLENSRSAFGQTDRLFQTDLRREFETRIRKTSDCSTRFDRSLVVVVDRNLSLLGSSLDPFVIGGPTTVAPTPNLFPLPTTKMFRSEEFILRRVSPSTVNERVDRSPCHV